MSERIEDAEHILVVHEHPEDGITIEHTPGCPTIIVDTDLFGNPYEEYDCLTAALIRDAGEDSVSWPDEKGPPGRYRVRAFAVGPGWAGSYPIEPEAYIEVMGAES